MGSNKYYTIKGKLDVDLEDLRSLAMGKCRPVTRFNDSNLVRVGDPRAVDPSVEKQTLYNSPGSAIALWRNKNTLHRPANLG